MTATKAITFGRYQKVEAILEADKAIKSKLGPKTEIVCRPPPGNEKAYFAKPVVYITEVLHTNGADAFTTSKMDVLRQALKLIQDGDGAFKIPARAMESFGVPQPASRLKSTRKPKAQKLKVVIPPPVLKKVSKGLAKASASSGLAKASAAPAAAPAAALAVAKKVTPAPKIEPAPKTPPSDAGVEEVVEAQTPGQAALKPGFPLAYGVSLVTLLMAVDQLVEVHDELPGKKERQQKLADLIREYQNLTVIPKNVKEILLAD